MPVHPSEEETHTGITEQIAKNPSSNTESTASTHDTHKNEHTPGVMSTQDIQNKGPAIPQKMSDLPPAASKDELKARAEELNK